ncbi:upstream-binding protein 1-like, partial [Pocillopora damicornis]|uniref:upstream-binding protein 1-like n=1 Tax=Pocillopora damicornis TaxID=46731 RepID=UPI000F556911
VTNGVNSLDPALQTKQETLMACGMSPPTQSLPMSSAGSLDVNSLSYRFRYILKAATSPTRRLEEDSLTYLNQGQAYLLEMMCLPLEAAKFEGKHLKSTIKLCFYERKLQVQESEKYEEWKNNRPADRMLEIDVPMSSGVSNIRSKGNLFNCYEFEWDPSKGAGVYVIVSIVWYFFKAGSQSAMSALRLSDQLRPTNAFTELTELPLIIEEDNNSCWMSPGSVAGSMSSPSSGGQVMSTTLSSPSSVMSSPPPTLQMSSSSSGLSNSPSTTCGMGLTSDSSVDETRVWLQNNRFQNYLNMFANYTGGDLLRLTKQDMIQIMGPADGIRLHNALQARAVRPLLTMYICLESAQQNSGMKEYHAMFLEALSLSELRKKLALKCNLNAEQIVAIYTFRQGPTEIYVLVDDEMVRNFADEGHFIVQLVREDDNTYQLILK